MLLCPYLGKETGVLLKEPGQIDLQQARVDCLRVHGAKLSIRSSGERICAHTPSSLAR